MRLLPWVFIVAAAWPGLFREALRAGPPSSPKELPGESAVIRRMLSRLDASGDGRLSELEWGGAFLQPDGTSVDLDSDGTLDEAEFRRCFLTVNRKVAPDEGLLAKRYISEGRALLDAGHAARALETLELATEQYPEWAGAWVARAESEERLGRLEQARHSLETAVRLAPNGQMGWLRQAVVLHRLGEPAAGDKAMERGLELLRLRAAVYGHGSRAAGEQRHLEGEILRLVNYFLDERGALQAALELLDWGIAQAGPTPQLLSRKAWVLEVAGLPGAMEELDRAAGPDGESFWILSVRGRIASRRQDHATAEACYRRALEAVARPLDKFHVRMDLLSSLAYTGQLEAAARHARSVGNLAMSPVERGILVSALFRCGLAAEGARLLKSYEALGEDAIALGPLDRELIALRMEGDLSRRIEALVDMILRPAIPAPDRDYAAGLMIELLERPPASTASGSMPGREDAAARGP